MQNTRVTRVRYNAHTDQLYPIDPNQPLTGPTERTQAVAANRMQDIAPPQAILQTMPQTVQTSLHSNYSDRAMGFRVAWAPMAWMTGGIVATIGAVGWSIPVVSLMTLLLFGLGFAIIWLVGWLLTVFISPDGVALLHAVNQWRLIHREHRARLGGAV